MLGLNVGRTAEMPGAAAVIRMPAPDGAGVV